MSIHSEIIEDLLGVITLKILPDAEAIFIGDDPN
jgi:hypothetical protein